MAIFLTLLLSTALLLASSMAANACQIPADYFGDWYWMNDAGADEVTIVNLNQWGDLDCLDIKTHPNTSDLEGTNATMLMQQRQKEDAEGAETSATCYVCVDVLYRTPNILQVRRGICLTVNIGIEHMCRGYIELPSVEQVKTYFRQTPKTVNCNTTFEGMYQFTYELSWGGGGICDNPDSQIQAYQDPGSQYVDNEVFYMRYAKCPGVQASYSQKIRYQCLGSWFAMIGSTGYTFAAIADTVEKDPREKFECLMTLKNQKSADNTIRWVKSRLAMCRNLHSLYEGPVRLVLRRTPCSALPDGYRQYGDYCVRVGNSYIDWINYTEARSRCEADGAGLFIIRDNDTTILQQALGDASFSDFVYWVGAGNREDLANYEWNDGSSLPSTSSLWNEEPDVNSSRCVQYDSSSRRLIDIDCELTSFFVCQAPIQDCSNTVC